MDDIAALRAELAHLQARVAELEQERSHLEAEPEPRSSRRDAFKLAAGAAVGAVAGAVGTSNPAAAADPNDLVLQTRNTAAGSRTQLDYTGSGNPMGLVVQSGNEFDGTVAVYPAAIGGWATQSAQPNGVYAYTNQADGWAVAARAQGGSGAKGAVIAEGQSGTGVEASGSLGLEVTGTVDGLTVDAGSDGAVVRAGSRGVVSFSESGAALVGVSDDAWGAVVEGGVASLLFETNANPRPPDRIDVHRAGEVDTYAGGEFWACVADGTPGTWRKLAGPKTAGSFHVIEPVRMFDSRKVGFPNSGRLERNQSRVISVADGRNTEGAIIVPDVVPDGATAISFNLTVDRTGPSNFLAVVPGSAGGFNSSSINWTAANSAVANGLTVGINAAREVKVFCGNGTGGTDFLIDVNGYYR